MVLNLFYVSARYGVILCPSDPVKVAATVAENVYGDPDIAS